MHVRFPEKTAFLFEPHRFKCLYGGRGSGKSWAFARALIILGRRRKLFIVCAREIQKSIKESVHKLIADQVNELGFTDFYTIKESEVVGANGTKFAFVGIRNNVASIKSMEAIDIFAIFEAATVTKTSLDTVLPTVRRDPPFGPFGQGSEIWVEFNPELETDEVYRRFVIDPPGDCVSAEMNWNDNPFFPAVLRLQKEEMFLKDPDNARTVWDGKTRKTLEGAIYAKELAAAISEGRLSPHIKLDPTKPCIFSFDLGDSDLCAWWAWQQIGMEHNAVAYYGNSGFGIDHYLDEIEARKLKVKLILLPHDAAQAHQSARGARLGNTIEKQVRAVHGDKVRLVPRVSVANRINAARSLFPRINIAEGACADGVQGLTHYQYGIDPNTKQRTKAPLHNWASNPADAFTYYAVWLKEGIPDMPRSVPIERVYAPSHALGWMG